MSDRIRIEYPYLVISSGCDERIEGTDIDEDFVTLAKKILTVSSSTYDKFKYSM